MVKDGMFYLLSVYIEMQDAPASVFTKLPIPKFKMWKITKLDVPTILFADPVPNQPILVDRWTKLRKTIDNAKNKLNTLPQASYILYCLDYFADIRQELEGDAFNMTNATNATIKMYELLYRMNLLRDATGTCLPHINVFCNAELPGGFIIAINHFVKTHCAKSTFDWVGNSLWPQAGETQLDDELDLYKKNPDHWVMGPTPLSNGDVTDPKNFPLMINKILETFHNEATLLYTSDIGVAFPTAAEDKSLKNMEEEIEAILNFGQIVAGLMTLSKGGNLVTKQFTFTTPFSRSLIGLVASLFETTYIAKPQTSRVNNSEVYLVAKNYEGIATDLQESLLKRLNYFHVKTPLLV